MTATSADIKPTTFKAPAIEWWRVIAYFFMLSLVGLRFYPIVLVILVFLLWRWKTDRYFIMVELFILLGDFAFKANNVLPVKLSDFALVAGVIGFVIYIKNREVKRVTYAMFGYFAVLVLLASTSLESMSIQFVMMRNYLIIIAFFIPLLIFANTDFEWDKFIHSVVLHSLVICGFYVVDTFLLGGYILMPGALASKHPSTFFDPVIFMYVMPRHYPYGLYWLILCIIPITHKWVRLSWAQWSIVLLAIFASRTNSLLFALIVCYVCFRSNLKQVVRYSLLGVVALFIGYFADTYTGRHLRLADNIDQFISLDAARDDADLAEFGTGRMAQIIPKWQLLSEMDRLDVGFGFLHPTLTTNPVFQIRNEYYTDVSRADELATAVEVTQVQTILDCGYLGLLAQFAFYIGVYFIIRRLKYSSYYLCAFVGVSVLGIGGFAGVTQRDGLLIVALALATVFLANKPKRNSAPTTAITENSEITTT